MIRLRDASPGVLEPHLVIRVVIKLSLSLVVNCEGLFSVKMIFNCFIIRSCRSIRIADLLLTC
jgi:hypothetical protein